MLAVDRPAIIQALHEAGADPALRGGEGPTAAADLARAGGHAKVLVAPERHRTATRSPPH